jgi:hypothetical protein
MASTEGGAQSGSAKSGASVYKVAIPAWTIARAQSTRMEGGDQRRRPSPGHCAQPRRRVALGMLDPQQSLGMRVASLEIADPGKSLQAARVVASSANTSTAPTLRGRLGLWRAVAIARSTSFDVQCHAESDRINSGRCTPSSRP